METTTTTHFPALDNGLEKICSTMLMLIGFVATIGNTLVLLIILRSKDRRMKVVPMYLLCVQAIPDLFLGLLLWLTGIAAGVHNRFPGVAHLVNIGGVYFWKGPFCTFYGYILTVNSSASICTIFLIAWERHCTIFRPFSARLSTKTILRKSIVNWFIAFSFSAIPFAKQGYVLEPPHVICYGLTGPGVVSINTTATIAFFLSLVAFLYLRMYVRLRTSFNPRNQAENEVSRQFLIIILCFLVCWLPGLADWILGSMGFRSKLWYRFYQSISFVFSMSNSAVNSFLCLLLNKKLRKSLASQCRPFRPATTAIPKRFPQNAYFSPMISKIAVTPLQAGTQVHCSA